MTQTISQLQHKLKKLNNLLHEQIELRELEEPGFNADTLKDNACLTGFVAASLMNKYSDRPASEFGKAASQTFEHLFSDLKGKNDLDLVLSVLASIEKEDLVPQALLPSHPLA